MGHLHIARIAGPAGVVVDGDGRLILSRCHRADRPLARLIGLLGTDRLAAGEGLWITDCRSVHTWGMRMAIGCLCLDRHGVVVARWDRLPPGRLAAARAGRGAAMVECAAAVASGVTPGTRLYWRADISAGCGISRGGWGEDRGRPRPLGGDAAAGGAGARYLGGEHVGSWPGRHGAGRAGGGG